MSTSALLAIGFVNPLLLGGLGMVLLPILIHFLSRRRFRRIDWAATLFLRQAEEESRRRTRFEQWLLLALRCLAMALLALLFARPFVEPGIIATLLGGGATAERIILIDDSASLGYLDGGRRELDRLTLAADRLLGWLGQSGAARRVSIYLTSEPNQPWLRLDPRDAADLARARSRLASLPVSSLRAEPHRVLTTIAHAHPTPDGGDSATAAALAGDDATRDASPADTRHLYILSDFQRSDWLPSGGRTSAFAPLMELAGGLRVALISSAGSPRENVAVAGLRAGVPQAVVGMPVLLTVGVANHSARPSSALEVTVDLDGRSLPAIRLASLMPGERREAVCELTPSQAGYGLISATLTAGDGFPVDDARRLVIPVRPALNVLIVNGDPHPDPRRDEVHLLRHALAPPGPLGSGMQLRVVDAGELDAEPLDSFDAVVLCNVPAPSEAAADALERFVRHGGGLLIFLGERVGDFEGYNRVLYADGRGLLPVLLREIRRAPEGIGLLRAADHPATAMFPAGQDALSESVRFTAYYASEPPAAVQEARPPRPLAVLARFADAAGTPALVERPLGAGRVLLFTSTCDLDWSTWPRSLDGSYVVAMLELVRYVATRPPPRLVYEAGESLAISLVAGQHEPGVLVRAPWPAPESPVEVRARVDSGSAGALQVDGPRLTQLGRYDVQVRSRTGDAEAWPAVVNLPAPESDLLSASRVELAAALGPLPHEFISATDAFVDAGEQSRRELWRFLLLLGVAALLGEQALGWRFGLPRAAARSAAARQGVLGRILSWRSGRVVRGTR